MGKEEKFGENINTNGLDKNPQNINKEGRPKKIYTIIKEMGYSADDIKTAFNELGFYQINQLDKVSNDDTKPIIVRIVAKQFKLAYDDGNWNKIKEILEHVIGKPVQPIELPKEINIPPIKFFNTDDRNILEFSSAINLYKPDSEELSITKILNPN